MAQRSKVAGLPEDVRKELEAKIVKRGFSGYDALETWLDSIGISIGKSSIHRYGKNLQRKLDAIKASTDAARLIAQEAPDDADQRSAAVISMIQAEMFDVLVNLGELDDPELDPVQRAKILSSIAKNVATLSRASVSQKRHEIEIRGRLQAVADKLSAAAKKKGGLTASTVDAIRREILGIAPQ